MQTNNQFAMQTDFNNNLMNLVFKISSNINSVIISISPEKLFREAINMFKLKIGSNEDFKFIFNGKNICPDLKISQSGLSDNSVITVFTNNTFSSFKMKRNPITISFEISITNEESPMVVRLECWSDDKVSDAIDRLKGHCEPYELNKKFYF